MATAKTKTRRKVASKPPSHKAENPEQYQRFRDFAREHETDDDPASFDRSFKELVQKTRPET